MKVLRTWISEKIVTGPSRIHGNGIFVSEPVAAGEVLLIWGGVVISEELAASGNYQGQSIWPLAEGTFLAYPKADRSQHPDEDINHSCDANTWLVDARTVVARRDIAMGEELTLDQGTWNTDDLYTDPGERCGCGSPKCRGILTGEDWKLSRVRLQYAHHFHPIVAKLALQPPT